MRKLLCSFAWVMGTLLLAPWGAAAWTPKQPPLTTPWTSKVDPAHVLPEYPRPQLVRADWLNLNGVWQFQPGAKDDAAPFGKTLSGEILVPFPVESALSGVMNHSDRLWYRQTFDLPPAWRGKRVRLNFGAVDFESEVYVNGKSLGVHKGGYDPFSYDITPALKETGSQELIVRVYDPTDAGGQPRGKQTTNPGGIMYTPTTGIWQTVWLEPVDAVSVSELKITPDVDHSVLRLTVNVPEANGQTAVSVQVKDGGSVVQSLEGKANEEIEVPVAQAKLWSPENPFLYDLAISVKQNGAVTDEVSSYFGMRKIQIGKVDGFRKMLLNNKFVFEMGPLDQGFWPDGIYTAPTDEAIQNDLAQIKAFGFNMVRKHIKVEPARWYYWTDKMGLLVWQDMPSANSYFPGKPPAIETAEFTSELKRMVQTHWNTPSIIMWDIFNEGQGQFDTGNLVQMVKTLDPSRLVNEASGGNSFGFGDVNDVHHYPAPMIGTPPHQAPQAMVCGEYGGIGYTVDGHTWNPGGGHGYTEVSTPDDLLYLYADFADQVKDMRDKQGLSAVVYTQVTDVETELNGLMTYDRIPKVDPAKIKAATQFTLPPPTYQVVLPTSEKESQTWSYTLKDPGADWTKKDFQDAGWPVGPGGFGKATFEGRTPWKTSNIWLRKKFNVGELTPDQMKSLVVRDFHDDDVEVYINGVKAYSQDGFTTAYEYRSLTAAGRKALVSGAENVLAVHCLQKTGGQFIDVGLDVRVSGE